MTALPSASLPCSPTASSSCSCRWSMWPRARRALTLTPTLTLAPNQSSNPHPHPNPTQASVKAWASVPKDDRIALVRGGEVIVEISSRRYDDIPMVLQGPGAGLKITAAGVFADLLRLSRSLVSFNVPVKVD